MCNLEYTLSTAHSSTIHNLINRLQITVAQVMDIDLYLILRCITLGESILHYDPLQLGNELIGRLRQLKGITFINTFKAKTKLTLAGKRSASYVAKMNHIPQIEKG